MSSYGTDHTAPNPTVAVTLGPTYATYVNAVLDELRTTLEAKVTPSGMDMNANLSMLSGAVRYGLVDTGFVKFYAQPTLLTSAAYPGSLQIGPTGELYYNDTAGNQAVLTAAGFVAGSAGSITSLAAPATVTWDLANLRYVFKSDVGADDFAHIALADLLLQDGSSHQLRLESPSLAADYTLTLPNAVPAASGTLMQFAVSGSTATGSFSNTGLDSISLGANEHFTVSGTGKYKHGTEVTLFPACMGGSAGAHTNQGTIVTMANTTNDWYIPITLPAGASISQISFYVDANGTGSKSFKLISVDGSTGTPTTHETVSSTSNSFGEFILTVSPEIVMASGSAYYAAFDAGDTGDVIYHAQVSWNRP